MRRWAPIIGFLLLVAACGDDGAEPETAADSAPAANWSKVDLEGDPIPAVVSWGEGFAGVSASGAVVGSSNGMTWSPAGISVADGEEIVWVDGGPWGAVGEVVGADHPELICARAEGGWTRTDPAAAANLPEGERWIRDVVWGEPGLLAVYGAPGREGLASDLVWSADGQTWEAVEVPDDLMVLHEVAAAAAGYLLIGEPFSEGNPGLAGWLSPDGRAWEPLTITDLFLSTVGRATAWGDGFMVSGFTFDHDTEATGFHLWESADGQTWTEVPWRAPDGVGELELVDSSSIGAFAVAWTDEEDLVLLLTEDGVVWTSWSCGEALGAAAADVRWEGAAVGPDSILVPVGDGQLWRWAAEGG